MQTAEAHILVNSHAVKADAQKHPRALYALECSHDSAIPVADMHRASEIDLTFEASHPEWRPCYPSPIDEARMAISYYKFKVLDLIAAKRSADAAGVVNRTWTISTVLMWLHEWRRERRHLRVLLAATMEVH